MSEFETLKVNLEAERDRSESRAKMLRQETDMIRKSSDEKAIKFRSIVENLSRERDALLKEKTAAESRVRSLEAEVTTMRQGSGPRDVAKLERELTEAQGQAEDRARQLSKMEGVVDRLRKEIDARESSNRSQLSRLGQSLQEAEYATARAEALNKALAKSMTTIAELEAKLEHVKGDLATVAGERDTLRTGLRSAEGAAEESLARESELEARLAELAAQKASLEQQLLDVHDSLQEMNSRVEQMSDKHRKDLQRVMDRLREFESVNVALEGRLKAKDVELSMARDHATEKVSSLSSRVDSLQSHLEGLMQERNEAHARMIELEAEYRRTLSLSDGARQVSGLAFQKIKTMQGTIEAQATEAGSERARTAQLEADLVAMRSAAHAHAAAEAQLRAELSQKLGELEAAHAESARLSKDKSTLSAAQESSVKAMALLVKDKARKSRRLAAMRAELERVSERLAVTESAGEQQSVEAAALSADRARLTATLAEMEARLAAAEAQAAAHAKDLDASLVREAEVRAVGAELEETIRDLRGNLAALENQGASYQTRIQRLEGELAEARNAVEASAVQIAELEAAVQT